MRNRITTSLALAILWHQKRARAHCSAPSCEVTLKQMLYMQLEMAKAGVNLFVEKPLSVRPAAEVAQLAHELKHIQEKNK